MPLEINDIDTNKLLSLIRLGRQELLNQDFIINDVVTPTFQIMTIRSILAHNVRLGTLWSDYFPKVIELFRLEPNENDAARIVETCFLTGTKQELLDCFSLILLESSHQGFYWRLHPQLRNFILKIAKIEQLNILESIILNRPENATLIPIEFTFLFTFLTKQENSNYAWIFFKRHKSQILEIMQDETILNIDQKDFVVMVFDLAIAALDCDEAKFLISKLSLNSPERQICLQKLLTLTSKYQERESKTESPIAKFVDEIKQDPKALQSLLNKVRSESQDRIFINSVDEFLRKFTDEIKPDKKVYYEVSRILAGSRDLIDLLPNLFQFFLYQSSSKLFLEPISARVWEVWNLVDPKNETEEFWSRVALLQKHLTGHTEVFDNLWIKIEGYRASKDCQTQKTHKWWSIFIESQLEHIQNADRKSVV